MKHLSLSTDLIDRSSLKANSKEIASGQSYVHTRSIKLPTKEKKRTPLTRAQRAKARLKTKKRLIALCAELNEKRLVEKLQDCSKVRGFLTCGQHEHKKVTNFHCQFRLCPYCAEKRSRDLFRKYYAAAIAFVKKFRVEPVHLVLTQPQIEGETATQSRARIIKAFQKLVRADRKGSFWNEYFKGGIWSVEIKIAKDKDNVYHTHLHILAFRTKQFSIKEGDNKFRDEWRAVGGGENFRLRPVKDIRRGLTEVLKYISKPLDIDRFTANTLKDFINMKNLNFVGTFGEFRKFASKFEPEPEELSEQDEDKINYGELEEGSPCPDCSQPLFELRLNEDEYIRYLEGVEMSIKPHSQ